MTYRIEYGPHIDWKRFRRLPNAEKERIRMAIEQKLTTSPHLFGKPLRNPLFSLWSLRVGDYRIVYRIMKNIVSIELIGLRATMYPNAEKIFG